MRPTNDEEITEKLYFRTFAIIRLTVLCECIIWARHLENETLHIIIVDIIYQSVCVCVRGLCGCVWDCVSLCLCVFAQNAKKKVFLAIPLCKTFSI